MTDPTTALREALHKYGCHLIGCDVVFRCACNCGLDRALALLAEGPTSKPTPTEIAKAVVVFSGVYNHPAADPVDRTEVAMTAALRDFASRFETAHD